MPRGGELGCAHPARARTQATATRRHATARPCMDALAVNRPLSIGAALYDLAEPLLERVPAHNTTEDMPASTERRRQAFPCDGAAALVAPGPDGFAADGLRGSTPGRDRFVHL